MRKVATEPLAPAKVPERSEAPRQQAPTQPRKTVETPKADDHFRAASISSTQPALPTSKIHFFVHSGMEEIQRFAAEKGWLERGLTQLSVSGQDLVYTIDNWKTQHQLRSSDVPTPVVNGFFSLPNVPKGTTVEFAIHLWVGAHVEGGYLGHAERGDLWLNNGGRNYTQVTG
jgi:hypothetical protein